MNSSAGQKVKSIVNRENPKSEMGFLIRDAVIQLESVYVTGIGALYYCSGKCCQAFDEQTKQKTPFQSYSRPLPLS